MTETTIRTQFKLAKEQRELAIYNEYNELINQKGAMATAVDEHLMKKYNIFSRSTIWVIRQRVAKRMEGRS